MVDAGGSAAILRRRSRGVLRYGIILVVTFGVALSAISGGLWINDCLTEREEADKTIAFIAQTTGNELWEAAHAGAERVARQSGFRIYWNGSTRSDDVERQIDLIQAAIDRRDAGLVVAPVQFLAVISSLREAQAKNIPVVVVSTSVPLVAGNRLFYILNDDQEAGRMAARRVGFLLKGKGTVAMLGLNANVSGLVLRAQAFETTLAGEFPGISIVERKPAAPSYEEAAEIAERVLLAHPTLGAIYGITSTDSEGALTVARIQHRIPAVYLVGCDQELDLMEGIREGQVDSIIAENSFKIGEDAIAAMVALRKKQTVQPYALIEPVLVTRENIDNPAIQTILSEHWRGGP
jgi:ribose transport system substrate-binding protein